MKRSRVVRAQLVLLMGMLLLPAAVLAQTGAIGGSVTDETGGVLPGVTVEAASPALIEGVRSTVTDGAGLYTIEALRPGTYTVTFTLPGFSTFVREGIELVSDFTANVDGTMTVGSIEETVTVSGASPVIDVQNVVSQQNLSRETIDTLPTSRTYFGLAALTPGMTGRIAGGGHDVGGTVGDIWGYVSIHGASEYDGIVMWDGMSINNNIGTGGGGSKEFFLNQVAIEEMVISTSDMNAEYAFGGVATNAIPKEGANTFSYYVNVGGTNGDLQSANVDSTLQGRGASPLAKNRKVWDYGVGVGGPLAQDRVWFYTSHRWWGAQNFQPSGNVNIAPGYPTDPGAIGYGARYIADEGDPAWTDFYNRDNSIRFTIQATERNKLTLSQAFQDNCACHYWPQWGITDMAASQDYTYAPINLSQVSWTFPASNRLLFEAGFSRLLNNSAPVSNERVREDADALAATGMTFEQFMRADPAFALQYVDVAHMSYAPLLNWRSHGIRTCAPCLLGTGHDFPTQVFRASMSYVTGSHNFKVGTDGRWAAEEHAEARLASNAWPIRLDFFTRDRVTGDLGGGPGGIFLVHQFATPRASFQNSLELGFYAQDQWTIDRLTLNLGVRYDHLNAHVPAQTAPAGRWGARNADGTPFSTPRIDNVPNYHDITPRLGVAYDLTGDGRTAIKATWGKYVTPIGTSIAQVVNPMEAIQISTPRVWLDFNQNLIPDCDLDNFGNQIGLGGECGGIFNPQFGTPAIVNTYDPNLLEGWGTRQHNWQNSVSVQHELTDNWSVEVGWFRTQYGNFHVVDNENIGPADFLEFSIAAPAGSDAFGLTPRREDRGVVLDFGRGSGQGVQQRRQAGVGLRRHEPGVQRHRREHRRPLRQRVHARRRVQHRLDRIQRVLRGGQSASQPRGFLRRERAVVGADADQVERRRAAAVRHAVLVRLPEPVGPAVGVVLPGGPRGRPVAHQRPARRAAGGDRDDQSHPVGSGRRRDHRVAAELDHARFVRLLLRRVGSVRAAPEPVGRAFHEDLQHGRRALPRLGRPVQHLQREQRHRALGFVRGRHPARDRRDGRPAAEVRRAV